jgi:hypothetical protein
VIFENSHTHQLRQGVVARKGEGKLAEEVEFYNRLPQWGYRHKTHNSSSMRCR